MNKNKQRHGCLTVWLIWLFVGNLLLPIFALVGVQADQNIRLPNWVLPVLVISGILNVIFVRALFQWKKWGFYGFVALSIIAFFINLSSNEIFAAGLGLTGIPFLYLVLQIGKENKGWPQLE